MRLGLSLWAVLCLYSATALATPQADDARSAGDALFEDEVRPLLEAECFSCHGPHAKRLRGGLMMSSHEALLEGGDGGPALVPGDPSASLLIELVTEQDADYRMPPKSQLTEQQVAVLERWVELGAPWPGGEAVLRDTRDIDLEAGREWWSFKPLSEPELPTLTSPENASRCSELYESGGLDSFVFAALEAAQLSPAALATEQQLVRRLHFDLLGLPPTPERLQKYLGSSNPNKWSALVDELLARPEYADRQGRAWLDVVRFAQTNGYERDAEKPMAWRYRDYVIRSFHEDKPYDQFLREQLAGDEQERPTEASIIATGLYRLGTWDSEPDDRAQADLDAHDDVLRTIGEGMLGLTIGCARCHDHRTDPIRQEDYYSLLAMVQNVAPYRKPKFSRDSMVLVALDATEENLASHEQLRVASRVEANQKLDEFLIQLADSKEGIKAVPASAPERKKFANKPEFTEQLSDDERLQLYLMKVETAELEDSFEGNLTWALAAREQSSEARPTPVLKRGRADSPLNLVSPGFPPVLCATDDASTAVVTSKRANSTGRRAALAEWVSAPTNPLTARVMVNRLWQGHFGVGICDTPGDFGVTGGRPTHPELLDWLALRFIESGWSVKHVHRLILNSYTYRMASSVENERAVELDPQNRLLWRQNLRRLDAESVRDTSLFVAGKLNLNRGGRGYFPRLSREALAGASKPGFGWELSTLQQRDRRSVYSFAKRGQSDPLLEVFDLANPSLPTGRRAETTVASQALSLLNSEHLGRCAVQLAERVATEHPGDEAAQLERMFHLTLSRSPREAELEVARDYMRTQALAFSSGDARFVFRASIPDRVEVDYLEMLEPHDMLWGPREGWSYLRGDWGLRYNQTEQADELKGPGTLLDGPQLEDGVVSAQLRLATGTPFASLLLRAHATGDSFVGLQLLFDRAGGQLRLLQHIAADAEPTELASEVLLLDEEREYDVRVELAGSSVRVLLGEELVLEDQGTTHTTAGHFGLRTWGAGCELRDLRVDGAEVEPLEQRTPARSALASFALVLLNLNEFLYVD